ncbi:MAG: hypothetical protein H6R16_2755 [Proteobacteria bacterium]|nr:hypothetical protein [Pseudomonadota bacterium]
MVPMPGACHACVFSQTQADSNKTTQEISQKEPKPWKNLLNLMKIPTRCFQPPQPGGEINQAFGDQMHHLPFDLQLPVNPEQR